MSAIFQFPSCQYLSYTTDLINCRACVRMLFERMYVHVAHYCLLSVIVRENRARPKDRGRPFTFIFSQSKSYPKILTTMTFAEAGVRFLRDITTS